VSFVHNLRILLIAGEEIGLVGAGDALAAGEADEADGLEGLYG
jgi:hypothetical protein